MPATDPSFWKFTEFMPPIGYRGAGTPGVDYRNSISTAGGRIGPSIASPTPTRAAPTLNPGRPPGPFDASDPWMGTELWPVTGNVNGDARMSPGSGGSIWGEPAPIQTVPSRGGRSPGPFEDPGLDWTGRVPTVGEPIVETPTSHGDPGLPTFPDNPLFPILNTQAPTAPVTGDVSGNAGLTHPGGFAQAHPSGSGLQSFGNNLTLGEFFNTPLSSMHYGEGYPPVQTSIGSVHGAIPTGRINIDPETGQPYDLSGIPEATLPVQTNTYPDIRQGTAPTEGDQGVPAASPEVRQGIPVFDPNTQYHDVSGQVQQLHTTQSFADNKNQGGAYVGDVNNVYRDRENNLSYPLGPGARLRRMDPTTGDISLSGVYNPGQMPPGQTYTAAQRDQQGLVNSQMRAAYSSISRRGG